MRPSSSAPGANAPGADPGKFVGQFLHIVANRRERTFGIAEVRGAKQQMVDVDMQRVEVAGELECLDPAPRKQPVGDQVHGQQVTAGKPRGNNRRFAGLRACLRRTCSAMPQLR